jgi:hypothetical protein
MGRLLSALVLAALLPACSDGDEATPPVFHVRSPVLFTFQGQRSGISVEVDGRARFSVIDEDGRPRGTGVAEQSGRYEIEFDPTGLSEHGSTLSVVAVRGDSGGRARAEVLVRHGALGIEVLSSPLTGAALLSDGRVVLLCDPGVASICTERAILLQTSVGSTEFEEPLGEGGAGARTVLAPGPGGDFFAGGEDDVVLHYDSSGVLCDTIQLLPTQVDGGDAPSAGLNDLFTQFGGGPVQVTASHSQGFSGFDFTSRPCAGNEDCLPVEDCPLDAATAFSTGTCLTGGGAQDFRGTAVALDGDRVYTGGFTFNVRVISAATNQCVDIDVDAPGQVIDDIAVSAGSVWVAFARGITRMVRDFETGTGVARPAVQRYGEGRDAGDELDALPSNEIRTLTPVAGTADEGPDGVWFGTDTGFGRILRGAEGDEVAWVSGLSLPGRRVVAILAPQDNPSLLWVATDAGLARLLLPAEE